VATDTTETRTVFETRTFDDPDDRMSFAHGHVEIANIGGRRLLRVTFEPGFRWSVDMSPVAKTELCQMRHVFYVISGGMNLRLADGSEGSVRAGDLVTIAPNHDSWVVGDEPIVFLDIEPHPDPA
jgi:quercetin dioxygenase-like cupin family protein